jgi:hypothetical protein
VQIDHFNPYGFPYQWFEGAEVEFVVPPFPQSVPAGESIRIWPALEGSVGLTGPYVLQPVLSVGPVGNYGSNSQWSLASWWCEGGHNTGFCFHGPVTTVNSGDIMRGGAQLDLNSTCNDQGTGCSWWVQYSVNYGTPVWTWVSGYTAQPPTTFLVGVLETSDFTDCPQLPSNQGVQVTVDFITVPKTSWQNWDYGDQGPFPTEHGAAHPASSNINCAFDFDFDFNWGDAKLLWDWTR